MTMTTEVAVRMAFTPTIMEDHNKDDDEVHRLPSIHWRGHRGSTQDRWDINGCSEENYSEVYAMQKHTFPRETIGPTPVVFVVFGLVVLALVRKVVLEVVVFGLVFVSEVDFVGLIVVGFVKVADVIKVVLILAVIGLVVGLDLCLVISLWLSAAWSSSAWSCQQGLVEVAVAGNSLRGRTCRKQSVGFLTDGWPD